MQESLFSSGFLELSEVPAERTTGRGDRTTWKRAAQDSGVHPEAVIPEDAFQPDYDEEVLNTNMPSTNFNPTALGIKELEVININSFSPR